MFNIIDRANNLLRTTPSSYSEILYEFTAEYKVDKANIPSIETIIGFTADVPETDVVSIVFSDGTTSVVVNTTAWTELYKDFVDNLYE